MESIDYNFYQKNRNVSNMSVYNSIKLLSKFYEKKQAIDCLNLTVNYKKLLKDSVTISLALKELGVKKGNVVAVNMPEFYQAVATFLACNRIGAVTTFLNSEFSNEEVNRYLNIFESPILVNYNKSKEENKDIRKKTSVKHIITLKRSNVNSLSFNEDYRVDSDYDVIDYNSLGSIAKFQRSKIELHGKKNDSIITLTKMPSKTIDSRTLTNEHVLSVGKNLKDEIKSNSLSGDKILISEQAQGFLPSVAMTLLNGKTAVLAPNMSKETINTYIKKNPNIIIDGTGVSSLIMENVPKEQDLSSIEAFVTEGKNFMAVPKTKSIGAKTLK